MLLLVIVKLTLHPVSSLYRQQIAPSYFLWLQVDGGHMLCVADYPYSLPGEGRGSHLFIRLRVCAMIFIEDNLASSLSGCDG